MINDARNAGDLDETMEVLFEGYFSADELRLSVDEPPLNDPCPPGEYVCGGLSLQAIDEEGEDLKAYRDALGKLADLDPFDRIPLDFETAKVANQFGLPFPVVVEHRSNIRASRYSPPGRKVRIVDWNGDDIPG